MTKKKALAAVLVLTMVCSLSASAKSNKLKFFTGGDLGVYYSYGKVLADTISETTNETTGYRTYVTVKTSGGSDDNISNIKKGKADLAFAQSDVISYAYSGTRTYSGGNEVTDFSVVGALYSEQVQIVTCDPDIKTVSDLKGKTVSVGDEGSGVYYNAKDIIEAYGMDDRDFTPVYQGFGDSTDSLQNGSIDAAFIVAGTPTQAVTFLGESSEMHLVALDDEHIETLIEKSPYYSKSVISADIYGLDEDVLTVDVDAVLIASNTLSDDDVYNVIANIFDNMDVIAAADDKGSELDLEMAASVATVPYHPGAAKYYEEQGITVPTA